MALGLIFRGVALASLEGGVGFFSSGENEAEVAALGDSLSADMQEFLDIDGMPSALLCLSRLLGEDLC